MVRIGIALSGGPDSWGMLALAHAHLNAHVHAHERAQERARALAEAPSRQSQVIALVVDHGLRPGSVSEAQGVAQLANKTGLEAHLLPWQRPARFSDTHMHGRLRAARWARYALLADAAKRLDLDRVWVGHTREDQWETLVMRWRAGSGVIGLAGLSQRFMLFDTLFERPALGIAHEELKRAATDWLGGETFLDDPSNHDRRTFRGWVRQFGGRGGGQYPNVGLLADAAVDFGRWRSEVERRANTMAGPLSAGQLRADPLASASWINTQIQWLNQREHAPGFERCLALARCLIEESTPGASRRRHTLGGVSADPIRDRGEKAWSFTPERDPRQRDDSRNSPNAFWRNLFPPTARLMHNQAFPRLQVPFAIAWPRFATTLD